jgi:hypothetical protein
LKAIQLEYFAEESTLTQDQLDNEIFTDDKVLKGISNEPVTPVPIETAGVSNESQ